MNPIFFLDIDTQKDFLYSDGSCYMQNGEKILPVLQRLTRFAMDRAFPLISTVCIHELNETGFHNLPVHCLRGRDGAAKVPESLHLHHHRIENHHIDRNMALLLQQYTQIVLEKAEDGLLGNANSLRLLGCLGKNSFIYGCNESSMAMAITSLIERGIQAVVVEDACAWREPAKGCRILSEMERRGVKRISSKQLFTALSE